MSFLLLMLPYSALCNLLFFLVMCTVYKQISNLRCFFTTLPFFTILCFTTFHPRMEDFSLNHQVKEEKGFQNPAQNPLILICPPLWESWAQSSLLSTRYLEPRTDIGSTTPAPLFSGGGLVPLLSFKADALMVCEKHTNFKSFCIIQSNRFYSNWKATDFIFSSVSADTTPL